MTKRPLLISDCDEVLLHMVVPFRDWLDEDKDIHFDLESGTFVDALRYKSSGEVVDGGEVWKLLNGFFDTQMHRQNPIIGAVDALSSLSDIADVVVLTNLMDHRVEPRTAQLQGAGIDVPVYTNQGGKGEAMQAILDEYDPSVAVFVDDLAHQHESIAEHNSHVWRLHMVGEPIIAKFIKPSQHAHGRIDSWAEAEGWVRERLLGGDTAPPMGEVKS